MKDNNKIGKQNILKQLFVLLILPFVLCGCATTPDSSEGESKAEDISVYLARIAELEAEIVALREQQYAASQQPAGNTPGNMISGGTNEEAVFHYRVEEGQAFITGFEGTATMVQIPETLDGYPVCGIDDRAFESTRIATISLPEGMASIGWFAFYDCAELVEISIPVSVTSIGYAVFDGCDYVRIVTPADSYAAKYAESYGLNYTEE